MTQVYALERGSRRMAFSHGSKTRPNALVEAASLSCHLTWETMVSELANLKMFGKLCRDGQRWGMAMQVQTSTRGLEEMSPCGSA